MFYMPSGGVMEQAALVAKATELRERLVSRQAAITLEQARVVNDIAECAETGAWEADGARDLISWVMVTLNIPYPPAADLVGLARRLRQLPALAQSFAEGRVGLESAGAAAKLATPETDAFFAEQAETTPAKDLLRAVRRKEALAAQEARPAQQPSLRWTFDRDGWCRFQGWLPPDAGAQVIAGIERAQAKIGGRNPETGEWDRADTKAARALVELSDTLLGDVDPGGRASVVVHVDWDSLINGEGAGRLAAGGVITADAVRKFACYGRITWMLRDQHGLLGIGHQSRNPTPAMATYLRDRDGGCVFPGCGRTRHLHMHHIQHWANGGRTDVSNLCLVCTRHHGLLHEGRWQIVGNPEPGPGMGSTLRFVRPDGSEYLPHPAMVPAPLGQDRHGCAPPPCPGAPGTDPPAPGSGPPERPSE